MLTEPPVCDRCINSPDSIAKLEQHAFVLGEDPKASRKASANQRVCETSQPAVKIGNRRNTNQTRIQGKQSLTLQRPLHGTQRSRRLPVWMSLLPSNVNPHVKPPSQSILLRRMSFPSYSTSSSPTPYMTPLEWPTSHDDYVSNHPPYPPSFSLDGDITPRALEQRKRNRSSNNAYTSPVPLQSPIASFVGTTPYSLKQHATSSNACIPIFYSRPTLPINACDPIPPFDEGQTEQKILKHTQELNTPLQTQAVPLQSMSRPPFMKELTTFLTSRSAEMKLILPSRALERTGRGTGSPKIELELEGGIERNDHEEQGCCAMSYGEYSNEATNHTRW